MMGGFLVWLGFLVSLLLKTSEIMEATYMPLKLFQLPVKEAPGICCSSLLTPVASAFFNSVLLIVDFRGGK